jgi:crotonobetainyl-CoA:carnitine CoA-transferase CaiB-like acyl-CoA transferase
MGGMFGALGAVAALYQRGTGGGAGTGPGRRIDSGLFENCAFLVAQHMLQFAVTGAPAAPMPARLPAWGIYDVFTLAGGTQLFLAVVSDTQWQAFCAALERADWAADERLRSNPQRVAARSWLLPQLTELLAGMSAEALIALATRAGLPWAPITAPEQLYDDPHLTASGGLAPMTLPDGRATATPLLPLAWDGARLPLRSSPPRIGEHTRAVLASAGVEQDAIEAMIARGVAAG